MSTVSPSASSPTRRRDGNWGEYPPPYYHENGSPSYSRGHPHHGVQASGYYGPPPPRGHQPPPEYWSYEPHRSGTGYWGAPPPYEGYPQTNTHSERHMPPPSRVPRGPLPPPQHGSPRSYQTLNEDQQPPLHGRVPSSPRGPFPRGAAPVQSKREFRHPQPSQKDKKKGDPLSILANVSAGMSGKDGQSQQRGAPPREGRHHVSMPAPTSPLQRRTRPSPITPNQTPPESKQRTPRHQITPISSNSRPHDHPPAWDQRPEPAYMDSSPSAYYPPRRRLVPPYGDYGHPGHQEGNSPALVERGSFDSQGEAPPYRDGHFPPTSPPSRPYYYDEHPPSYGVYWDGGQQHSPQGSYPPPRWNYGQPPEGLQPEYSYDVHEESYPHHRPPPPLPPHHAAPYTYVQQPRLEEKTILRKKFSWKHYPELERFLIGNRDEYLKHSNMNYTAEQKQYNNWLTERLLEVAAQHHYVFDPDDFNFVAIRDRIRCYYKSYVQTARKRGLKLPEKKKD